jgi:hypothetical protein
MDEQTLDHFDPIEWTGRTFPRREAAPHAGTGIDSTRIDRTRIDRTRVSLLGEREMRYWTGELHATIYQLRDAIQATGSRDPAVIRAHLRQMAQDRSGPDSAAA